MEAGADTLQKALQINLDPRWYGTIAEIGAGQEVVRWFFRAGGAAGTVAKSMSAYDMAVSDAIYGKSDRYVSHGPRSQAMLDHEYELNLERLGDERGDDTAFFAFADTVVGAQLPRRQRVPRLDGREVPVAPARRAEPDHPARADARRRGRAAAGGARHRRREPAARRVLPAPRARAARREPARPPDHRPHRDRHDRVHGHRVPRGRQPADGAQARAARASAARRCSAPTGEVLQPSEVLRKKAILVERGSFRPPTVVNIDMLECGAGEVRGAIPAVAEREVLVLTELTMAQPAGRRRRRRPARLPGPRRPARRLRHDRAHLRLRRLPPARRLPGAGAPTGGSAWSWACPSLHRPVRRDSTTPTCPAASWRASAGCSRTTCGSSSTRCCATARSPRSTTVEVADDLQPLYDYLRRRGSFVAPRQLQARVPADPQPRRAASGSRRTTRPGSRWCPPEVARADQEARLLRLPADPRLSCRARAGRPDVRRAARRCAEDDRLRSAETRESA